jgi:hypothetical protein
MLLILDASLVINSYILKNMAVYIIYDDRIFELYIEKYGDLRD